MKNELSKFLEQLKNEKFCNLEVGLNMKWFEYFNNVLDKISDKIYELENKWDEYMDKRKLEKSANYQKAMDCIEQYVKDMQNDNDFMKSLEGLPESEKLSKMRERILEASRKIAQQHRSE